MRLLFGEDVCHHYEIFKKSPNEGGLFLWEILTFRLRSCEEVQMRPNGGQLFLTAITSTTYTVALEVNDGSTILDILSTCKRAKVGKPEVLKLEKMLFSFQPTYVCKCQFVKHTFLSLTFHFSLLSRY